jgi:hypothetical protein
MSIIETDIKSGEPIHVGDLELTPQTRVLRIKIPGYPAGIIWNRPKAVIVRTSDGQENILPVRDVTRIVIWAILAGGLLGAIATRLIRRNR